MMSGHGPPPGMSLTQEGVVRMMLGMLILAGTIIAVVLAIAVIVVVLGIAIVAALVL